MSEINVIAAKNLIESDDKIEKIDVRKKEEFEKSNLNGFRNIPLPDIAKVISSLNTRNKILLLDQTGEESKQARVILDACGFETIIVRGGLNNWAKIFGSI